MTIFSVKSMQMRDIIIVPSTGWGGDGLLGLTIVFCKIEDVSEQAYRILAVSDNSPAAKAGLRADVDFVLAPTPNTHNFVSCCFILELI